MLTAILAAMAQAEDPYYTGYHAQALHHWLNDPNGPLYFNGYYHLFFQYNPAAKVWGPMHWYHMASKDLLTWTHLPVALAPDDPTDCGGVYSGSGTIVDNIPTLSYSVQCGAGVYAAVPTNVSDPLLVQWTKLVRDPMMLRPEGRDGFRDPTTAWRGKNNEWRMLVGCDNGACQYESTDFKNWDFLGTLKTDQDPTMWECPDLFPIPQSPEVHVLKTSPYAGDWWTAGKLIMGDKGVADQFVPMGPAIHKGQMVDHGAFYASKTFNDPVKKRQILWGWSNYNCKDTDWTGIMTFPRVVSLDQFPADPSVLHIITQPIPEIATLYGDRFSTKNVDLEDGETLKLTGVDGRQVDIYATVEILNWTVPVAFGLSLFNDPNSANGGLTINWETVPGSFPARPQVKVNGVVVDVTPHRYINFRVIVDRSVAEVFTQYGRVATTLPFCPPNPAVEREIRVFHKSSGAAWPIIIRELNVTQINTTNLTPRK